MAKGYWVVCYRSISDPEKLAAYGKLAGPSIAAAGGEALVLGGKVTAHEAGVAEFTVVVTFDSYEQALAAYESEAYQQAIGALDGGVVRDFRIVEGV